MKYVCCKEKHSYQLFVVSDYDEFKLDDSGFITYGEVEIKDKLE